MPSAGAGQDAIRALCLGWVMVAAATGDGLAASGKRQPPDPAIELVKTGTFEDRDGDGFADAGDAIRYRFDVTNAGGVPLAEVRLRDPLLAAIVCPESGALGVGRTRSCSGAYVLTQADVDRGFRDNAAIVTALDPSGEEVAAEDAHREILFQGPAIRLVKSWSAPRPLAVGSIVTYGYGVRNAGDEPLTDVRVADLHEGLGPITCVPPQGSSLPPAGLKKCKGACGGEPLSTVFCAGDEICLSDCEGDPPAIRCLPAPVAAMRCSATYSVTLSDFARGTIDNTGRVTAEAPGGDPGDPADDVGDGDFLSIPLATAPPTPDGALRLLKNGAFDVGGDGVAGPGDLIRYTFQVTNVGGVTLTQVAVIDPLVAVDCPGGNPIPELTPGTTALCIATYEVTQEDVDAGFKNNTALATGRNPEGGTASAQSSHRQPIADSGGGPGGAVPFPCTGDAYIVQNENAQLTLVDQTASPFTFVEIGGPAGTELNNLGFRSTDGLLYAVELSPSGNLQIVRIDSTGTVFGLGRPAGLPNSPRFDGGDVTPDGTAMYVTANGQPLYRLSLTSVPALPEATSVTITGDAGLVFDWAVSPADGLLYGGDSSQGELAILDPATGVRTDVALAGLPAGVAFGGAWFDASGQLFLYRNSGAIFEIDPAVPAIGAVHDGPGSSRNDGAACIELEPPPAAIRLSKTGAFEPGENGFADAGEIVEYVFEVTNAGTETLTGVVLEDPAVAIVCPDGGRSIPSLAPGASAVCTGSYVLTPGDVAAGFKDNVAAVTATGEGGDPAADQARHRQVLPVPEPTPEPFACTGDAYIIQNENAQLTRVDVSTSPFTFVEVGGATGTEINNLGFRSTDGLLYGVELGPGSNLQIVRIDRNGTVFGLGRPPGLPAGPRFDAGDVTPDGSTLYVHANRQALYRLDLTAVPALPAVTSVPVTGAGGLVFDWAVRPADGRLYGGDSTHGQLAVLDPETGVRNDFNVAGLPAGVAFGGAWFDAAGRLFLYRNSGAIFEIDLAGPRVADVQLGPGSTRNDGAACIP